ncbi:MAG TPA: PA0069 family radical SAM protein [Thermoanaerobaculia bacterium]|nr:PA0069 family radical SAM protein [Thermoanaerobaculia bacterium]
MSKAYVPGDVRLRGRGTAANPPNRFERLRHVVEADDLPAAPDPEAPALRTTFHRDASRTILATNDSPDIPFDVSLNPYRGCEHGCAYCYARPTHEFLGFSAGLDFESRILVKEDAPELLRRELSRRGWRPQVVALSGVTDPYQPVERKLRLTRRCLEVFLEFRNPVSLITKSDLVVRDADLLAALAVFGAAAVAVSIATLDDAVARALEPRAPSPRARLEAVGALAAAGVPCGVYTAPAIPGLNDHEIPAILAAAKRSGARWAGVVPLRLPGAVAGLFVDWLDRHLPLRKEKILGRLRDVRGGRLNDPDFGSRMRGDGAIAEQIGALFRAAARREGLGEEGPELSAASFRVPSGPQLPLFP